MCICPRPAALAGWLAGLLARACRLRLLSLSGAVRLKRRIDRELWIAPKCASQRQWTRLWYYPPCIYCSRQLTQLSSNSDSASSFCIGSSMYVHGTYYRSVVAMKLLAQFTHAQKIICHQAQQQLFFFCACLLALFKLWHRITILPNYLQLAVFLHNIGSARVT